MKRFTFALAVLAALAGGAHGATFVDVGGPFPDGRDSLGINYWCDDVLRVVWTHDPDFQGQSTIFVSNAGNDANDGSQGAPKQTLAGVATALTGSSTPINVKFKCGDTWRAVSGAGLDFARPVKVSCYGAGALPRFTRATATIAGNHANWSAVSGTTYQIDTDTSHAGINVGQLVVEAYSAEADGEPWWRWPFFWATNAAAVPSNPYSYYCDPATHVLTVNFGNLTKNSVTFGVGPNSITEDYCFLFGTGSEGSILEHVAIVGWEMLSATAADSNGTNAVWIAGANHANKWTVVRNCEFCQGGRHFVTIGVTTAGANAGCALAFNKAAYWSHWSESAFVCDPADSAKPTFNWLVAGNVFGGGLVPNPNSGGPKSDSWGNCVARHGDVSANAGGMIVVDRNTVESFKADKTIGWGDAKTLAVLDGHVPATAWTPTTWDQYKQVVNRASVNGSWNGSNWTTGHYQLWSNSIIRGRPANSAYGSTSGETYSAVVNCDIAADLRHVAQGSWAFLHQTSANPSFRAHKSTFTIANSAALASTQTTGFFDGATANTYTAAQMAAAPCEWVDSAMVYVGSVGANPRFGFNNNATNVRNAALGERILAVASGATLGGDHGNVTSKLAIPDVPLSIALPYAMVDAGGGSPVRGDRWGASRGATSSIGHTEGRPAHATSAATIATATRVEIDANSAQLATIVDDGVTVAAMGAEALQQFLTDDTGETAAADGSVAALSGGGAGGGGAGQPRINKPPTFVLRVSDRRDGRYACTSKVKLRPGAVGGTTVGIDMRPIYGDADVADVGTPLVVGAGLTATGLGPRDEVAVVQLGGATDADATFTVDVPVTMETGEEELVRFEVRALPD